MRFLLILTVSLTPMLMLLGTPVMGQQKYCGIALNEVLDLLCVNGFPRRIKRHVEQAIDGPAPSLSLPHIPSELQPPQLSSSVSPPLLLRKWHSLLQQAALEQQGNSDDVRRYRRRIVHECCKNGCTYDDILQYCA